MKEDNTLSEIKSIVIAKNEIRYGFNEITYNNPKSAYR